MKNQKTLIYIIIALAVLAIIFIGFRIFTPEDTWLCQNGQWVKHGNPSAPQPIQSCGNGNMIQNGNSNQNINQANTSNPNLKLTNLQPNQKISSPFTLSGEARLWYFEGSFPLRLEDNQGKTLATGIAQALDDWMTEDFVPFMADIEFTVNEPTAGVLILTKDNPSGLPQFDEQVEIPVMLEPSGTLTTVKVFFNNNNLDPQVSCNKVFPVNRQVPQTTSIARAALQELLKGPTLADENAGYFTSLNNGVKIQSLKIENNTAYVDFDNQLEYQVGGSCRVSAIRAQIAETLKQFSTVQDVVISIDGRTEDILQP